ncbi:MAG: hypothetical protein P8008_03880 [Gammaproteobacteria bacterium]
MILKRLSTALRRQDWTAFAVEFLIVVIGIYAAFQLDRWRELETARSAYENFTRMLSLELDEKLPDSRRRVEMLQSVRAEQNAVIQWLNGDQPRSRFTEEMCFATFRSLVLNWSPTRLETAAFMVTGDRDQNVQDMELQRLLLALGSLQEQTDRAFDRFVLQIVNISDRYPELLRRQDPSTDEIREGLVCAPEGMRANQAFKNQLFGNIGRQSALLDSRLQELELLERIDARVGELQH